ncbi:UNVERIFIED_CONTAM: hypothetical protein RMT77_002142 [Armadillidium vulgare]
MILNFVMEDISIRHLPSSVMTGTLGILLLLLPLAAPLIAQDTVTKVTEVPETRECQFYNETCANSEEGCPAVEYCSTSDQNNFARCFVTWTNSSTHGIVVSFKGCIYHDPTCRDKCVSEQWTKGNISNLIFYCCCYGNSCNNEFMWDPKETSTSSPTRINTNSRVLHAALIVIIVLISIFVLLVIICFFYKRRKMANFMELPTIESTALTHSHPFPNLCSRPIQLLEIKAQGRFGAVWKASYCNNVIAVKIFPSEDYQSWLVEKKIFTLPHMKHENILHFIGVDEKGDRMNTEYWLMTSYHENGSLFDFLKGNILSWAELCHVGESMARGLAYLHCEQPANRTEGVKPAIAHRDFKSKNVLLKNNLTACIADFGLALTFYPGQVPSEAHGQVGTRRYMAPEVLEGAISFQRDAFLPIDMYACGLVLWEMISRCSAQGGPVPEYVLPFEKEVGLHPTLDDMQECVVTRKKRPHVLDTWLNHPGLHEVIQMIRESWDHDAEARLSASCIVERFALLSRQPQLVHTSLSNKRVASF